MVSRTWRGVLHDIMVIMWVHISERVSPWGCAISGYAGWRPKEIKWTVPPELENVSDISLDIKE